MRREISMPIWTIRNRLGDAFGPGVLDEFSAIEAMQMLCEAKRAGLIALYSGHDDDIYPWDPENPEDYLNPTDPIHEFLGKIKQMAESVDLKMNIITCDLHGHALWANGGFTNPDPAKRLLAAKKALRAAWMGKSLGAQGITYWTARDGFEVTPAIPWKGTNLARPEEGPYQWLRQALNRIRANCRDSSIVFGTIEPKCNEPRQVVLLPLVGSALWFITTLADPEFWGVNPEIPQHSAMANQEPLLEIVQAVEAEKLPFLHLGGQTDGQFDNDNPPLFGPTNLKRMIQIFVYLDEVGWDGVVEFDCHALRSDAAPGKLNSAEIRWNFLVTCLRMYRLLEEVVSRIITDTALKRARQINWQPSYLDQTTAAGYADLLAGDPTEQNRLYVLKAKVDAQAALQSPAHCGAVEEAFTFSMFGIEKELLGIV